MHMHLGIYAFPPKAYKVSCLFKYTLIGHHLRLYQGYTKAF